MFFENPFKSKIDDNDDDDLWLSDDSRSNSIMFERYDKFDDGEFSSASSVSAVSMTQDSHNILNMFERHTTNHLMLLSLLEYICMFHTKDEVNSGMLFKILCERLSKMKLMPENLYLDEFKAVRLKHQGALMDLMKGAVESMQAGGLSTMHPEKLWQTKSRDVASFTYCSWYTDMFHCEEKIGHGGFGHVMKAKNKLDGKYYAIKKVVLLDSEPHACLKTLREVQVISHLNHQNIVRYHSSWLEYGVVDTANDVEDKSEAGKKIQRTRHDSTYDDKPVKNDIFFGHFGSSMFKQKLALKDTTVEKNALMKPALIQRSISNGNMPYSTQCADEVSFCCGRNHSEKDRQEKNIPMTMILYIQMELCHGTLRDWLKDRNTKVKDTRFVRANIIKTIFKQMVLGVQYIHSKCLLHRDLKPANIFINIQTKDDIVVKIGDFGLARHDVNPKSPSTDYKQFNFSAQDPVESALKSKHQTVGVGTTTYAAPEQKTSHEYSNKVDIYSLGIIFYELLKPFDTEMERIISIKSLMQGTICTHVKNVWVDESSLLLSMTSLHPNDRPSATEVLMSTIFATNDEYLQDVVKKQDEEIEKLKQLLSQNTHVRVCMKCQEQCPHKVGNNAKLETL